MSAELSRAVLPTDISLGVVSLWMVFESMDVGEISQREVNEKTRWSQIKT